MNLATPEKGTSLSSFSGRSLRSHRKGVRNMRVPSLVVSVLLATVLFSIPLTARPAGADLYVCADLGSGVVMEYNGTTGAFEKIFAQDPYLIGPRGLVFGPNGDLFVSSLSTNQVLEYKGATSPFIKSGFSNVKVFRAGRRVKSS